MTNYKALLITKVDRKSQNVQNGKINAEIKNHDIVYLFNYAKMCMMDCK